MTPITHVCLKYTPGVVVSIVTRLRWTSQESWSDSRQRHEIFFLLQSVETGSGAHPLFDSTITQLSFPMCKANGA